MKKILFLLTTSLLVACGGGGEDSSVVSPSVPTVTTTTPPPPPPPPPPPEPVIVLDVEVGDAGDRFYPVEVDITYTIDDVPQSYDYTVTIGHAEETDTGLLIYGDGRLGDGILVVNDEEYQFTIIAEPTCAVEDARGMTSETRTDCAGYFHGPPTSEGFIYYGEDDTTIVEWEIVYMHFDAYCSGFEENSYSGELETVTGPCDPDDWIANEREQLVRAIDKMNEIYATMGVYVKLVPVRIQKGYFNTGGLWIPDIGSDLILWNDGPTGSWGGGITCGWAGYGAGFRPGIPLQPYSACGIGTTLHEIGHTLGLGHGPNNGVNPGGSPTFPNFGVGAYSVCPNGDSIMSYGNQKAISNSLKTCDEMGFTGGDMIAGYRIFKGYDEAYAINRVRYNVALINNNRAWVDPDAVEDPPNLMGYDVEYNIVRDVYPAQQAIDMINEYRDKFEIDVLGPHKQYK